MRITRLKTFQPIASNSPPDWRTSLGQIGVAIETNEGLVGYGVGGGGAAGRHVICEVLEPLLVGRDVEPIEEHWQRAYDATLAFGRKGIAIMAISGVDLALWDLRAKAANVPMWRAIRETVFGDGATFQPPPSLPTYSTVWDEVDEETAAGTSAVKLHAHVKTSDGRRDRRAFIEEIVAKVSAAREAIGPSRELMLDAWMEWDIETTLAIAERIAPFDIEWIEEPLPADDLEGYRELCRHCAIPIAGGEHEFTARGFQEIIDRQAHHILQPDVCWCGGLTELVQIDAMAKTAELRVVPHRGAEVWALHAIAALASQPLAESGREWMSWVDGQPAIVDGQVSLPTSIGFGVTLIES